MRTWLLPAVLLLVSGCGLQAQDSTERDWELHGYQKWLNIVQFIPGLEEPFTFDFLHNRLNFAWYPAAEWTVRVQARTRLFYGESADLLSLAPDYLEDNGEWIHASWNWWKDDGLLANTTLDRFYLDWSSGKWQLSLGRQRVNWGMNTIWNPNDIWNAYNFLDFDYEERPGTDALRVRYYPALNAQLEFCIQPASRIDRVVAAALYRFNSNQYDFQFLAGHSRTDAVLGLGWAGNLGDAGFKGEASCFLPWEGGKTGQKTSFDLSATVDYTWSGQWYGMFSFLWNTGEEASTSPLFNPAAPPLSARNLFPYPFTLYAGVQKTIADRWGLMNAWLFSPKEKNLIWFPALSFSASEQVDLDLNIQVFLNEVEETWANRSTALFLRGRLSF